MVLESPSETPLQIAVATIGSQSLLARLIGVTQGTVWKWLRDNKPLPAEHVLTVERETGISRHALRPDLYPDESDRSAVRPDRAAPHDDLERAR